IDEEHPRAVVASVWRSGKLLERCVIDSDSTTDANAKLQAALAANPGATLVHESIVGEGPVATWSEAALAISFVPGRDGIAATLAGRRAYVTPDDLLALQAYDKGVSFESVQLTVGVDMHRALAALSSQLGTTARELLDRGTLHRIRVVRTTPQRPDARVATPD